MGLKTLAAAACISFVAGTSAFAATFNVTGGFSGGELGTVVFDFTVTNDFSADIAETNDGLSITTLTSSVVAGDPFLIEGGLGYGYSVSSDSLEFGGLANGLLGADSSTDDFAVSLFDFTGPSPVFNAAADTSSSMAGSISAIDPGSVSFVVTEVAPVPLPAGGLLLLTGLGGVTAFKRRKKRAA